MAITHRLVSPARPLRTRLSQLPVGQVPNSALLGFPGYNIFFPSLSWSAWRFDHVSGCCHGLERKLLILQSWKCTWNIYRQRTRPVIRLSVGMMSPIVRAHCKLTKHVSIRYHKDHNAHHRLFRWTWQFTITKWDISIDSAHGEKKKQRWSVRRAVRSTKPKIDTHALLLNMAFPHRTPTFRFFLPLARGFFILF